MLYRSDVARHWLDDFNHRVRPDRIDELIDPSEERSLYRWTRRLRPYWLLAAGSLGGVLGGLLPSPELWLSPRSLLAALALALLLAGAGPFTAFAFGRTMRNRVWAVLLCGALVGLAAQAGGRVDPPPLGYAAAAAAAALTGLLYSTRATPWIRGNPFWTPAGVIVGAGAAVWGARIVRYASGEPSPVIAALAGGCAATAFFTGLLMFFGHYFDAAGGLRDLARIYAHNEATLGRALSHLDEALRLHPRDAELYSLRGTIRSMAGDFEGAERDWRRIHELLPKRAEPIMNRGLDLSRKGRLDEALELIEEARRLSPAHPLIHCNLGVVHGLRGDQQAALRAYSTAIELQPSYPRAYSNRAYAWLSLGRYDEALRDADEALRQNPGSAMAHVHRGQALAGLGRAAEAAGSFRTAIRTGGEIGSAEEAVKGLEELGLAP